MQIPKDDAARARRAALDCGRLTLVMGPAPTARRGLRDLVQQVPYRALFPHAEPGEPPMVVVTSTSGGIVGGDRLGLDVTVEDGARLLLMPQAAERVYRTTGPVSTIDNLFRVGRHACFEWLPQETIIYDRARFERRTRLMLADQTSRALFGEILVLGRTAHGESVLRARLRDAWAVERAGRLVLADAFDLAEEDFAAAIASPSALGGMTAIAGFCGIGSPGETAGQALRDRLRRELEAAEGPEPAFGTKHASNATGSAADPDALTRPIVGIGLVDGCLVVRMAGGDAARLKRVFDRLWAVARAELLHHPPRLPRIRRG
ncbi:urease accessory protein UreD [Tistrella mobilis]|uniref:Urease accessory protein UreD n=1 Tax=Tistrella mobilis (strain KA081020-065) TaxID=1110502 RepID=I3TLC8_TISMK|nr:urease accessory protein UreD [Tistrella mobilis]AFK53566.1 urease accessory protein UreD [Tistrella mobilis KA081020-065]